MFCTVSNETGLRRRVTDMRFLIVILAMLALSIQSAVALERVVWEVDGQKRHALVHLPTGAAMQLSPLVFGFHGHGGRSQGAARNFGLHRLWPEAVVVYPQGLPTPGKLTDPEGKKTGWQQDPRAFDGRDLKFFDAMLKTFTENHGVDPARVYSTGHSNGGGFTYQLWINRPGVFAAIAPSASAYRGIQEASPEPLAVIHFAGSNDTLVKFEWQEAMMKRVCEINQCGSEPQAWGNDACKIYSQEQGAPLVNCTHDGSHKYPSFAPELIVQFFKENRR